MRNSNQMLDTANQKTLMQWHEILDTQTQIFLPFEVGCLFSSEAWQNAGKVLDVGCGNGNYIKAVSQYFPEKQYHGIDSSKELVALARSGFSSSHMDFEQEDFFALKTNDFDVVFMRLVLQHMSDLGAVLDQSARLLTPSGALLIIEPETSACVNTPETPRFFDLVSSYEAYAKKSRSNRALLNELPSRIADYKGWEVVRNELVRAPLLGPFANSQVERLFMGWIDLFESSKTLDASFEDAREEIRNWCAQSSAFSQITLRFLECKPQVFH